MVVPLDSLDTAASERIESAEATGLRRLEG